MSKYFSLYLDTANLTTGTSSNATFLLDMPEVLNKRVRMSVKFAKCTLTAAQEVFYRINWRQEGSFAAEGPENKKVNDIVYYMPDRTGEPDALLPYREGGMHDTIECIAQDSITLRLTDESETIIAAAVATQAKLMLLVELI